MFYGVVIKPFAKGLEDSVKIFSTKELAARYIQKYTKFNYLDTISNIFELEVDSFEALDIINGKNIEYSIIMDKDRPNTIKHINKKYTKHKPFPLKQTINGSNLYFSFISKVEVNKSELIKLITEIIKGEKNDD